MSAAVEDIDAAIAAATDTLLAGRSSAGNWRGRLAGSPLATATAVLALSLADGRRYQGLISRAVDWLLANGNADGGWGDTPRSKSNISTTLLVWSALGVLRPAAGKIAPAADGAEQWIARRAGSCRPADVARALRRRYGADRTFAVPILTACALAGRLGPRAEAWRHVEALPFELAACPRALFRLLGLPVVSYALPALIAVGQARFHHLPPVNPILRLARAAARRRTLRLLRQIQPPGGGFLEAAPLTGFVAMSLISAGHRDSAVVRDCLGFLVRSARDDGSWPIDTDLATWVTTLSIRALAADGGLEGLLDERARRNVLDWLLTRQHLSRHPYTGAPPGAWAWSDMPGAVPDADDTAGALLALRRLQPGGRNGAGAAAAGVRWLVGLQNADGGIPTFCRGWGKLPFDRSGADLTAHAVLAITGWLEELGGRLKAQAGRAVRRAAAYLLGAQRADGSYVPLWFGNEAAPDKANPTYGTARVTAALAELSRRRLAGCEDALRRAVGWLLDAQGPSGGWGGDAGVSPSIEETAVATEALAQAADLMGADRVKEAVAAGAAWLVANTDGGRSFTAAPIGLYFARLWYYEELYPVIFTVSALRRARAALRNRPRGGTIT